MKRLLSFFCCWFAACSFAAGTWNGVAITHWNGIAFSAWNGTGISAGGGGGGATDWTADATMKALYLFNGTPGLSQDSKNANHIDDATTIEAPAAQTSDKIEGSGSADFENTGIDDGLLMLYSNASADFPCNGTGDAEVTIGGWIKLESSASTQYVFSINAGAQFIRVLATNAVEVRWTGTGNTSYTSTATVTDATWCFVAAVYSDTSNELRVYIREQGAGDFTIETAASTIGTLASAGSGNFQMSGLSDSTSTTGPFDGLMDGWAVFNGKAMSESELASVFTNGWDGNGW